MVTATWVTTEVDYARNGVHTGTASTLDVVSARLRVTTDAAADLTEELGGSSLRPLLLERGEPGI